jgi:hypothetical protein
MTSSIFFLNGTSNFLFVAFEGCSQFNMFTKFHLIILNRSEDMANKNNLKNETFISKLSYFVNTNVQNVAHLPVGNTLNDNKTRF